MGSDGGGMSEAIIEQIEDIRVCNNSDWMLLLRIALKHAPDETKAVLRRIADRDGEVRRLTLRLAE